MRSVEHAAHRWADEITTRKTTGGLVLTGTRKWLAGKDLIEQYHNAIANTNHKTGNLGEGAHIDFANSQTDQALKDFVRTHGPVLAVPESVRTSRTKLGVNIRAEQNLEVLRREQQTIRAVMRILEQIRSITLFHDEVVNAARAAVVGTSFWLNAWKTEFAAKSSTAVRERPNWMWTASDQFHAQTLSNTIPRVGIERLDAEWERRAVSNARGLLCHILNAFPTKLADYGNTPLELPPEDVSFGILPTLYYFLRRDFLRSAKIHRCAWKNCARWFTVGAHDSLCCSSEHSLKYRQAEYYRRSGKATRALRRKNAKRA